MNTVLAMYNYADGTTIGILNSNGEIDSDKCDSLGKFPYYPLKEELGVTEQLRIEVQTLVPKETVCLWGAVQIQLQ